MLHLRPSDKWLFVGDSITDAGRRDDPEKLGNGYVRLIRDYLLAKAPADAPKIVNRGVGGDESKHLAARWQEDVIAQRPAVLSVMVGVNDVWRQLDGKGPGTTLHDYAQIMDKLLADTIAAEPKVQIVLCEPSVISPPAPAKGNAMLLPYAMAVRELAAKHGDRVACVVPMHQMCLSAERSRPGFAWWPDGVHPSSAGHMLLARTWLAETRLL